MGIKIKFDSVDKVEQPTFILLTRGSKKIGHVPAKDIILRERLNSYSEISFCVYKYEDDVEYGLWDEIKDFRLIYCLEWNTCFEITVEIDETDKKVKNIIGRSLCESELSQINLYNIEINTETDISRDDYTEPTVFYHNEKPEISLLNRIMEKAPHYKIKHVDYTISDIQKIFTFDGISLYDAMQEISEEIGCLFIFDSGLDENGILQRTISVYDLYSNCENDDCKHRGEFVDVCPECRGTEIKYGFGNDTKIFVSSDNLAKEIIYTTDTDSVKNCFKVEGGDELINATVRNCNPNGSDYIWYISNDTKTDMSEELRGKIEEYDALYEEYRTSHEYVLNEDAVNNYNNLIDRYEDMFSNDIVSFKMEMDKIENPIIGFPALMTSYYNAIDLEHFLRSVLMPTIADSDVVTSTDAENQLEYILSKMPNPIYSFNLNIISTATANSTVLSYAKLFVNSNYRVEIEDSSFEKNSDDDYYWNGKFKIINMYDEDDCARSSDSVNINFAEPNSSDDEEYIKQRIDKILYEKDEANYDITTLFSTDVNIEDFENVIRKYCLNSLISLQDACQSAIDILIEQEYSLSTSEEHKNFYTNYYNKLKSLNTVISEREKEIESLAGKYDGDGDLIESGLQDYIIRERNKAQDALNFENYLQSAGLWNEFCSFRRDDKYSNPNFISDGLNNVELFDKAQELLQIASNEIYKSAELQHSITSSLNNLLAMEEFSGLTENFEVGNWLRIKVDNKVYKLRLLDYEINFDQSDEISVTFSDVMKTADGVSDVQDILQKASSMVSSYDTVVHQASQGSSGNNRINHWVSKGLDMTNMRIVSSADNQEIVWDNHGLLMKEYFPITDSYSDKQLKIINKGLYVTDNNWETSKAAIGNFMYYDPSENNENERIKEGYGLIADTIIGNLILGENVGIYTQKNDITLNDSGFIITNKNVSNPVTITMNPSNTNGVFTIECGKDNYVKNLMTVTQSGELIIGENNRFKIDTFGKLIIGDSNFVVDESGDIYCRNITLGENCSINWDDVSDNGAYDVAESAHDLADSAYDLADLATNNITKLANGTYSGGTFINKKVVSSPTIRGGYIVGGKFFAVDNVNATVNKDGEITGAAHMVIKNDGITCYDEEGFLHGLQVHPKTKNVASGFSVYQNGSMIMDMGVYLGNTQISLHYGEFSGGISIASDQKIHAIGNWHFNGAVTGINITFG